MAFYALYDDKGRIAMMSNSPTEPDMRHHPGLKCLETDDVTVMVGTHEIKDGKVQKRLPTFDDARSRKRMDATQYFSRDLFTQPFEFEGHEFQIDEVSRRRLTEAMAVLFDPVEGRLSWIALDNSVVIMDYPTAHRFQTAVSRYVHDCVVRHRELKDQIIAADDYAALDAIDVKSGYPSLSS